MNHCDKNDRNHEYSNDSAFTPESKCFIHFFISKDFFQLFYSYYASVLFTLLSLWLNFDYQLSFLRFRTKLFFLFLSLYEATNKKKTSERLITYTSESIS